MAQWIALLVVGLGIGFLTGISISPTLSVVLTSLMGAAAVLTALFGPLGRSNIAKAEATNKIFLIAQPVPLALLTLTILIGAITGAYLRVNMSLSNQASLLSTYNLAPPKNISDSIDSWADLGLERDYVTEELFKAYLGISKSTVSNSSKEVARASTAGVFSKKSDECAYLEYAPESELHKSMRASSREQISNMAALTDNINILKLFINAACGIESKETK